ncbi:MAG: pyridoxamine 5'-phosphate oxidase family protein [Thermodesulfobacteriota bacterium]|nr:pyridoxamine 5'-phosphate oxidase family protein [Thermodesulfobacteriota bacterium]
MLEKMKSLLRKKDMCVLATTSGGKPHCSLMAYAVDENCSEIYMVTHRKTKKYENVLENPSVSLLVDTREQEDRSKAQALTVEGVFNRVEDPHERKLIIDRLLSMHPHLQEFLHHSDSDILRIKIASFLLLDGITEAHFEAV